MSNANMTKFDDAAKQLLCIAEQLKDLAAAMDNSTPRPYGGQGTEEACQSAEENLVRAEEKNEADENPKAQKAENSARNSRNAEGLENEKAADSQENKQSEKAEKVDAKPIENQSARQIGGGLNGMFGGFNMKNMPGLGNLFGGMTGGTGLSGAMGGLGGLSGLSGLAGKTPKSLDEIKNNPQIMSILGSLENNPALLNTIAAMSGMDKEQILNSIKALRSDSAENAENAKVAENAENSETTAEPKKAAVNSMGNLNLNSLGDLSRLFGGGQPAQASPAMSSLPNQQSAGMPMGSAMSVGGSMPLRGTVGGDPLANLLNQWHWTPHF